MSLFCGTSAASKDLVKVLAESPSFPVETFSDSSTFFPHKV